MVEARDKRMGRKQVPGLDCRRKVYPVFIRSDAGDVTGPYPVLRLRREITIEQVQCNRQLVFLLSVVTKNLPSTQALLCTSGASLLLRLFVPGRLGLSASNLRRWSR